MPHLSGDGRGGECRVPSRVIQLHLMGRRNHPKSVLHANPTSWILCIVTLTVTLLRTVTLLFRGILVLFLVPEDLDEAVVEDGFCAAVGRLRLGLGGKRDSSGLGVSLEAHLQTSSPYSSHKLTDTVSNGGGYIAPL